MRLRDDECFGADMDEGLDTDFDFEANLALFDKAAVFSQIDGTDCNGARSRGTPGGERGTPTRYRHDENILEVKPVVYRQITVPQHGGKEYCTGKRERTQHIGSIHIHHGRERERAHPPPFTYISHIHI